MGGSAPLRHLKIMSQRQRNPRPFATTKLPTSGLCASTRPEQVPTLRGQGSRGNCTRPYLPLPGQPLEASGVPGTVGAVVGLTTVSRA